MIKRFFGWVSFPGFHLTMMGFWVLITIPAILWWKESILFVILVSLYANFASEFSAYHSAKAERNSEK